MAYAAGSIVGSTPVGYLIDLFGPEALPISIAVGFLGLTVFLLRRSETSAAAEEADAAAGVEASEEELPEIKFDLSFLFEQVEKAPNEPTLADAERDWQERSLEEWFRRRTADVARLALDRRNETAPASYRPTEFA
jgi:hypothetical protein